jgi:hypothetical protein
VVSGLILSAIVALVPVQGDVQTPGPSPAANEPARPQLKTIITVKASPYCNSLAQHFNGAFAPMLANDRTLDAVSVQLDDLDTLFSKTDYAPRFLDVRRRLMQYDDQLFKSLGPIEDEIGKLKDGAKLSTDPQAAKAMTDSAGDLQRAFIKQRAMAIDLQGIVQGMMQYDITGPHPLNGWTPNDQTLPADAKNIKSYLRFDGQRDVINLAENQAVDVAYDAALKHCTK